MIARGLPFSNNPFGLLILIVLAFAVLQGNVAAPLRGVLRDPTSAEAWIGFVGFVVAIALGIALHEFMHAYTAHRFGDETGKHLGRLTLDPRAHLDLWGSLLIVLIGFGYGRPVPVNESRLTNGRVGMALVSLAGPLTNLAIAGVAAIPLRFEAAESVSGAYATILTLIVAYNCLLAVFNLVPVPPLDGSKVIYGMLPPREAYTWRSWEPYGPFILLAMIFLLPYLRIDVLGPVVVGPARAIAALLVGRPLF